MKRTDKMIRTNNILSLKTPEDSPPDKNHDPPPAGFLLFYIYSSAAKKANLFAVKKFNRLRDARLSCKKHDGEISIIAPLLRNRVARCIDM